LAVVPLIFIKENWDGLELNEKHHLQVNIEVNLLGRDINMMKRSTEGVECLIIIGKEEISHSVI
jgi:hypothetical protein